MSKAFQLNVGEMKRLIPNMGACIATDHITVEGKQVGYMYREVSAFEVDSGWRIFSGIESQAYVDDPSNSEVYDLNTIANYDKAIIPYLDFPVGTELERVVGTDRFE